MDATADRLYLTLNTGDRGATITNRAGDVVEGPFESYSAARDRFNTLKVERATTTANGKKRTRTVFPSDELPHLWMHKTVPSGRTSNGNLFFEGDVIFSYGHHFPIARHVTDAKGKKTAILYNSGHYSVTTTAHQSHVRQAIPANAVVFTVSSPGAYDLNDARHAENLKEYVSDVSDAILKAARARSSYAIEWELKRAQSRRDECIAYCKFFGLKRPKLETVPTADADKLAAIRKHEREKAAATALETRKREVARKEREATEWMVAHPDYAARWDGTTENAEALAREQRVTAWRSGEDNGTGLPYHFPTMLRIVDGEVQTSRGARFPVSHARRGLALVRAVMARGEEWHTNGHTCHLGPYSVQRITPEGTVHAGCHTVTWPEIEVIAQLMD